MAISDQLADFNAFAQRLAQEVGGNLTLDQAYDRWWEEQHRDEDLAAIQAAVQDYESGEQGILARGLLSELRTAEPGTKQ